MRNLIVMLFIFFSGASSAQELNTILEKHFEAHGQDLWDQVSSVQIDGEWVNQAFDKFPMTLTFKSPKKVRLEGTWFGKRYAEVTNGVIAWTVAPWTGSSQVQLMTPAEHLMIDNLYAPGSPLSEVEHDLQLSGLELYEGELYIKLVYDDANYHREYYLGKDDYVLYWEVIHSNIGRKHQLVKQFEKYKDYHGLLVPTALRLKYGNTQRELVFDDVALGVGAPDRIFEMPSGQ